MTALAASDDKAKTIRLEKTEGTVTVVDAAGKPVSLVEGMRLYNGYMVQTASESYAWLSLDDTKSVKMDENTQLELRKRGKKIQLNLISGSILVGASAHLEDDEELTIRTATMITGIRGTDIHASVFVPTPVIVPTEGSRDQVSIQSSKPAVMLSVLDGVVSSQNSKGAVTVSAGETVTVTTDAAPAVTSLSLDELGAFAVQEIKANDALRNRVDNPGMAESGITVDRILDHGGTRLNPGVVNSQTIPTQVKNLGIVKKSGEILHDIRAASTHTHNWGTAEYVWGENHSCTATRTCLSDSSHVERAMVYATEKDTVSATCTATGTQIWIADFGTQSGFETQVARFIIPIDPNAHDFDTPTYSWNGNQCTATRVCKNDTQHVETETVTGTYVMDTAATCTTAETGHYTVSFTNTAFTAQTTAANSVTIGNPLNHDYGTPSYSWNGSQCTATRVCKNDTKHVETETVTGAYSKDTDATCTTAETGHYTASFTNTAFTTQTTALNSITNGDPLGHSEPEANAWSYITDPQNSAEPGYYTYTCTRGCTVTELEYLNQALAAATAPVDAPYGQINGSKTDKPENKVLTIPAGKTLNADSLYVAYGYQVIVKGTLNVTGSIENYGTITVETGGKLNVTDPEAEYSESSLMNCATYTTQEQEEVIIEAVLTCSGEIVADRINNSGEIQLIGGSVTTQYLSSSSVLDIKQSSVLTTDSFCSFSGDYDSGSVTVDGSTFTLKKTEGSENSNEGSISVSNSGTLNIFDNLYADNGSITVDNTSAMNVTGTEEYDISVRTILNNSGTVNVSNASLYLIAPNPEGEEIAETLPIVENAGSITLAKNAQLYYEGELNETTVYGTLLNSGSISLSGSYVWAEVQNTGTITARLDSSYIYSVSNLSTIEVNKDAKLTVYFLNNAVEEQKTGSVAVDGTLILDSGKEQTMYSTNDGSILIRDGGSLELNTTLYHSGSMSVSGTVETGSLQYTVISAITNTEDPAYAWPAEGTSSAIGDLICCEGGSITVDGGTLKYNAMTPMPNEL